MLWFSGVVLVFLTLALADDAASLDADHPLNANMRDRGIGLVPRVVRTELAVKFVRLAAGAVEGVFRVPIGWHVIDDGKRTLVFGAGGRIQVNLSQRSHEGASTTEFARQLLQQHLDVQPELPTMEVTLSGGADRLRDEDRRAARRAHAPGQHDVGGSGARVRGLLGPSARSAVETSRR